MNPFCSYRKHSSWSVKFVLNWIGIICLSLLTWISDRNNVPSETYFQEVKKSSGLAIDRVFNIIILADKNKGYTLKLNNNFSLNLFYGQ